MERDDEPNWPLLISISFGIVVLTSILFTIGLYFAIRFVTNSFIIMCFVTNVMVLLTLAAIIFSYCEWATGIWALVIAAAIILIGILSRRAFPFAKYMLLTQAHLIE